MTVPPRLVVPAPRRIPGASNVLSGTFWNAACALVVPRIAVAPRRAGIQTSCLDEEVFIRVLMGIFGWVV
jgi:hypothetical protein